MSASDGDTDSNLSKLLSSAVLVFVGTLLSSSTTLLERVIVGRLLSPSAYGEFNVALSVFTLSATLGVAGFAQGVPRYMARFDDIRDVRGAWLTGLVITVGISTVIAGGLALGSPVVVPRLFDSVEATTLFLLFVGSIPLYISFRIGIGAIRGMENTRYKIITQNIGYPGLRLVFVTGLLLLNVGLVATGLGYLAALVVATFITYLLLNRILPLRGAFRLHTREMVVFSAPLVISTIMSTLLTHTDTLMLGYFRPSSEVGIYSAAYPIARGLTLVLGAFGYMYLPVASRLDSNEGESVERVYEVTTKWMFLLVFPLFVTLLVYPDPIITMVFGREYVAGGAALGILAVGFFTTAAVGRNRETLSALGATEFILVSNLVAFGFNFLLNLVLIPRYGFMGAAVASAGSIVVLNVVVYLFLRTRFGITPFNGRSTRAFVALPAVVVPLGFAFRGLVPGSPAVVVVFAIAFTVLTVVTVLATGSLEPEDIVVIELVEDRADVRIPFVRRYIPDE